jgi:hypothetical protein
MKKEKIRLISIIILILLIDFSKFTLTIKIYSCEIGSNNMLYLILSLYILAEVLRYVIGYIMNFVQFLYWLLILITYFGYYIINVKIYFLPIENIMDFLINIEKLSIKIHYFDDIKILYYDKLVEILLTDTELKLTLSEQLYIYNLLPIINVNAYTLTEIKNILIYNIHVAYIVYYLKDIIYNLNVSENDTNGLNNFLYFINVLGLTLYTSILLLYKLPTFILVNFMEYKSLYVIDQLFQNTPIIFNMTRDEYIEFCRMCIPSLLSKYNPLKIIFWP